ncbi:1113_t:CDS:1, partial [Ambispora gerdemannii]
QRLNTAQIDVYKRKNEIPYYDGDSEDAENEMTPSSFLIPANEFYEIS